MLSKGIDYNNLTKDETAQLDEYLEEDPPTPDFNIPGNEIFKYLFNKDTCRRVLEELMQWGYRVDGGETLGKTIIFAYNHKHAQMIVDCFHELYPEYPANTCQLVDYSVNYGDDLVLKFEEDDEFRIAVSVDMLDTGVDIPAVLNLVFFKKVRSKIKFVQMIGRGTRLCENIYGPGKIRADSISSTIAATSSISVNIRTEKTARKCLRCQSACSRFDLIYFLNCRSWNTRKMHGSMLIIMTRSSRIAWYGRKNQIAQQPYSGT